MFSWLVAGASMKRPTSTAIFRDTDNNWTTASLSDTPELDILDEVSCGMFLRYTAFGGEI